MKLKLEYHWAFSAKKVVKTQTKIFASVELNFFQVQLKFSLDSIPCNWKRIWTWTVDSQAECVLLKFMVIFGHFSVLS